MNWLNCFYFLISMGDTLAILIGCMIFLSPFLDVIRTSMSAVSFLAQLYCGILCLQNAFPWHIEMILKGQGPGFHSLLVGSLACENWIRYSFCKQWKHQAMEKMCSRIFFVSKACVAVFYQISIVSPNVSSWKTIKNVFYFAEKALFVLKIFKFL